MQPAPLLPTEFIAHQGDTIAHRHFGAVGVQVGHRRLGAFRIPFRDAQAAQEVFRQTFCGRILGQRNMSVCYPFPQRCNGATLRQVNANLLGQLHQAAGCAATEAGMAAFRHAKVADPAVGVKRTQGPVFAGGVGPSGVAACAAVEVRQDQSRRRRRQPCCATSAVDGVSAVVPAACAAPRRPAKQQGIDAAQPGAAFFGGHGVSGHGSGSHGVCPFTGGCAGAAAATVTGSNVGHVRLLDARRLTSSPRRS